MSNHTIPNPIPTDPPPRRHRTCLRWGCIAGILLLILLVAGVIFLRVSIDSKLTAQQKKYIQKAATEIVSLPAQWHQPATLPPLEIVNFHHDFSTSISQLREKYDSLLFGDWSRDAGLMQRLRAGDNLSAQEETSLTLFLAELQPVLDETSRVVRMPGYTFELDLYGAGGPVSSLLQSQVFAKFASIAAMDKMRKGNPQQAMEVAALPLRLVKRPPQSHQMTHLVSIAVASITAYTYSVMAEQTTNTKALRRGLELLTELRPVVIPGDIDNWRYGGSLSALRFAAANGYPVDLSPQPLLGYLEQAGMKLGPYYHKWITEHLPADDLRVKNAQAYLDQYNSPPVDYEEVFSIPTDESGEPSINPNVPIEQSASEPKEIPEPPDTESWSYKFQSQAAKLVLGLDPVAMLYAIALPNIEESLVRARVAMTAYDLARMNFARRLAELQAPTAAQTSLTAYITPLPDDPFTSAPLLFSQKIQADYSVGPDKKNGNTEILYDATNGTVSDGDLWLY